MVVRKLVIFLDSSSGSIAKWNSAAPLSLIAKAEQGIPCYRLQGRLSKILRVLHDLATSPGPLDVREIPDVSPLHMFAIQAVCRRTHKYLGDF